MESTMSTFKFIVIVAGILAISLIAQDWLSPRLRRRGRKLPGPRGYPVVGYLKKADAPVWKTYRRWSTEYGSELIQFNILGSNIVIANSLRTATDLLDKRSSIYSDRPISSMTMLRELVGFEWSTTLAPYGPYWRASRKLLQQAFSQQACSLYQPVQTKVVHRLLSNLLQTPEDFIKHSRLFLGGLAVESTYGTEVHSITDPYISSAERAMQIAGYCMEPGAHLVDSLSVLKYLPIWFPGAGFKIQAREWKKTAEAVFNGPYDASKPRDDLPDSAAKFIHDRIADDRDQLGDTHQKDRLIRGTLGTVYSAAADTSIATFNSFLLAMTLCPDVQKKIQEKIDRHCHGRLPIYSDSEHLVYVHALVKECLRWNPVAPFGIPHMVMEDDIYEGYHIPANSTVIANVWAIFHDPEIYPVPDRFNPDRFLRVRTGDGDSGELELDPDIPDPAIIGFGFGRRICPGRHFAYESLWFAMASVLAVFDISKALDENGIPFTPPGEYTDTFVSTPKSFVCKISPRSPEYVALIRAAAGEVGST